jgi:hypothetical protein
MPTTALVEALYAAICPFVPALTVPPPAPTVHAPPAGTACPAELNCTHWPLIGAVPRVATPPDVLRETPRTAPTPDAIPLPDWFMIWLSGVSVGAAGELLPLPMTWPEPITCAKDGPTSERKAAWARPRETEERATVDVALEDATRAVDVALGKQRLSLIGPRREALIRPRVSPEGGLCNGDRGRRQGSPYERRSSDDRRAGCRRRPSDMLVT